MTREQIRARNDEAKRARARQRKLDAAARESERIAAKQRITNLRLQGSALDKAAQRVKGAYGKRAIARQRAETETARKRDLADARARIAIEEKAERDAERGAKVADKERKNPLVTQEPKPRLGNRVIGAFKAPDAQALIDANLATLAAFDAFTEGFENVTVESARTYIVEAVDRTEEMLALFVAFRERRDAQ